MINEMMSSEESASGEEDSVTVHPLQWRSQYVNKMFQNIDNYLKVRKSAQASRQTKDRIVGSQSSHAPPSNNVPSWAVSTGK